MNIFLAGVENIIQTLDFYKPIVYDNWLVSFAYFIQSKKSIDSKVEKMTIELSDKKLMLDSGAYSRSTGAVDFTIFDYINFLHKYGNKFFVYVTLDIPMQGKVTLEVINHSIKQTEINTNILEKEGLKPAPVYQRRWQRLDILEKYLEQYDYIFLGGSSLGNALSKSEMYNYLDSVFELNEKYKKKLHGLGQTTDGVLKKYPFYSVDSTSWLQGTKSATIFENIMDKYKTISIDNESFIQYLLSSNLYDGFNLVKTNYVNRLKYNIKFYEQYQRILQELWLSRNIKWENYN